MSRIAKNPVNIPAGVEVKLSDSEISVKGGKTTMSMPIRDDIEVKHEDNVLTFAPKVEGKKANAMAGTTRALVNNLVVGVSQGFEKKLQLIGVGYRAQMQGNVLKLNLGLSHDVDYQAPDGITITAPKQTEIVVEGIDQQKVGQVAAEIREWRKPEPYKGKGIRYKGEFIFRKAGKKK